MEGRPPPAPLESEGERVGATFALSEIMRPRWAHFQDKEWCDMAEKFIYNLKEGKGDQKLLLGGKGANLCQMVQDRRAHV